MTKDEMAGDAVRKALNDAIEHGILRHPLSADFTIGQRSCDWDSRVAPCTITVIFADDDLAVPFCMLAMAAAELQGYPALEAANIITRAAGEVLALWSEFRTPARI